MKPIFITFILCMCIYSCENKNRKKDKLEAFCIDYDTIEVVYDTSYLDEGVHRTISAGTQVDSVSDDTLREWQRKVREEGDYNAYQKLFFYYGDLLIDRQDEMIEYSEYMINKQEDNDEYKYLFYFYVKNCNKLKNKKLREKSIQYLKDIASKEDGIASYGFDGRIALIHLYEGGIYVRRDTVISNYLEKGGRNIDSIFHARGLQ